ncbi:MAG: hypothetical protein WBE20_05910 [Candidatus Acidiferrales bacterium]
MKFLKTILLCGMCFLVAATATCVLRAKYGWLPSLKASYASDYSENVGRYSFLQYNQAGPEQGRTALLQYLNLLERIRRENIDYPKNQLHRDFALTYLRLYRIESAAGNASASDNFMKSAQKELLAVGAKEQRVSPEVLAKLIETHDSKMDQLYNETDSGPGAGVGTPKGKTE